MAQYKAMLKKLNSIKFCLKNTVNNSVIRNKTRLRYQDIIVTRINT